MIKAEAFASLKQSIEVTLAYQYLQYFAKLS